MQKCPDFDNKLCTKTGYYNASNITYCLNVSTALVSETVEESSAPCTQTELLAL